MEGHHFICYSNVDGLDIAQRLNNELKSGQPPFPAWLDKSDLRPGRDWDEQIVEAIRTSASLLFLMSPDSVEPQSVCKQEWTRALKYKKPIIPLRLRPDVEMPFRLGSRQHLDLAGNLESAIEKLRQHLVWLKSPAGELQALQDRQADARRDLRRATDELTQQRIQDEIAELARQIEELQQIVRDPQAAAQRVEASIQRGLARERRPDARPERKESHKFINPPPAIAPNYFQDRYIETGLLVDFLRDDAKRLISVVGRAGVGKTAMTCRTLKALEKGELPDGHGKLSLDGIVYLSASGSRRVSLTNLFADLSKLLPEDAATTLANLAKDPRASVSEKMEALLKQFPQGRFIVLLDNFEDLIDAQSHNIRDAELAEALRALLTLPHHAIKTILTTRIAPRGLSLLEPGRQSRIELDKGLEAPYAENILRAMDVDGKLGLQNAPAEQLAEARRRTLGFPRALEALFAILSADRHTSLQEVLSEADRALPENVVEVLVGEAFHRLDATAEKIMQALAVYRQPVPAAAVDYLLQPFLPGVDSAPVLNRLVSMHFVRKETGRYYLHPVDRTYAMESLPPGEPADRLANDPPPYSRFALLHRGAEYYRQARQPRESWKSIEDLGPQLAEFELRCSGADYDTAAGVLLDIDFDYLMLWGYYRLAAQMHEQLCGRLGDPWLQQNNYGNLGTAYYRMGQYQQSITNYQQALEVARGMAEPAVEAIWLGNMANCYGDLGQTPRVLELYQQALELARQFGDRITEASNLNNMGFYIADLGKNAQAQEYHRQALTLARQNADHSGESIYIANLGIRTHDLGQTDQGIALINEGLATARADQHRYSESVSLTYLGDIFLDKGDLAQSISYYQAALEITEETSNTQFQDLAEWGLALAQLSSGNFPEARQFADQAANHEVPRTNHAVFVLQGLIRLRQGEKDAARQIFQRALTEADRALALNGQHCRALDSKALSLCALALIEADPALLPEALQLFRNAREICSDPGPVNRVRRLLKELACCDAAGWLAELQSMAKSWIADDFQ